MLSRTAESLYWLARYMERAETMARLLEVGYRMALMPSAGEGYRNEWASLVAAAGSSEGFEAKFGEAFRQRDVETWLFFDRENPSSVTSCIETARQNGRAVRTALTTEMWDALNGAYLDLRELERRPRTGDLLPQLCDWTKRQGALLRGATEGTHLQNDGYDFLNLGYYLERGDNTSRLLDVKYYVLLPTTDMVGGLDRHLPVDDAAAGAVVLPRLPLVLRRRVQPAQDRAFPDPESRLPAVAAPLSGPGRGAPRVAGARPMAAGRPRTSGSHAMLGELAEAEVEDILEEGLHEFLTRFISQNGAPRSGHGRRLSLRGPVMRLSVRHGTVYQFDAPMRFVTQSHRLTPVSERRADGDRLGRVRPRARSSAPPSPTAPATRSTR